jgi:hypothetical protein
MNNHVFCCTWKAIWIPVPCGCAVYLLRNIGFKIIVKSEENSNMFHIIVRGNLNWRRIRNELECCSSLKKNETADFDDSSFSGHLNVDEVDIIRATCEDVAKCETIQSIGTTL